MQTIRVIGKEKLKKPDGDFEITHEICAYLAEGFKKIEPKQLEELKIVFTNIKKLGSEKVILFIYLFLPDYL